MHTKYMCLIYFLYYFVLKFLIANISGIDLSARLFGKRSLIIFHTLSRLYVNQVYSIWHACIVLTNFV